GHDALPLALVEPAVADVVFDLARRVFSFDVRDLLVDEQVLLGVDLGQLDEHDVRRLVNAAAEGVGGFDVGVTGGREREDGQSGKYAESHQAPGVMRGRWVCAGSRDELPDCPPPPQLTYMPRYELAAWVFGLVIVFNRPYCAASRVPQGPSIARMRRMNRLAQVSCLVGLLCPVFIFAQVPTSPFGPAPSDIPARLPLPAPPIPH